MDYTKQLENIKDWIKNLVIIQYRQASKNRALIDLLTELIFVKCLPQQIRDLCLSVDKSTGVQLDIVGKWVGIDRIYNAAELWNHPYLSFINYTDIKDASFPTNLDPMQGGFSNYETFDDNDGGFLMYKNWQETRTAENKYGDKFFRPLIKLKIIKNSINHTMKNIDEAILLWSGGELDENGTPIRQGAVYTTWQPMELTYHYDATAKTDEDADYKTIMTLAQYKNALPCPTGCKLVVTPIV